MTGPTIPESFIDVEHVGVLPLCSERDRVGLAFKRTDGTYALLAATPEHMEFIAKCMSCGDHLRDGRSAQSSTSTGMPSEANRVPSDGRRT